MAKTYFHMHYTVGNNTTTSSKCYPKESCAVAENRMSGMRPE